MICRATDWRATFKRTLTEFREDNLTDWAAALTYYAVLALFPALLVLVALLGLFGQYPQTTDALLGIVGKLGPRSAVDTFRGPIEGVVKAKGGAGALLGVGLLAALWSASGYIGAFFRASNIVYGTSRRGGPFWKLRPLQIVVTLVMASWPSRSSRSRLVVTGPLAHAVGDAIGLGGTAVTVWDSRSGRSCSSIVTHDDRGALLHRAERQAARASAGSRPAARSSPCWSGSSPRPGSAFYVAHFGSYNKTYGSLGGVIVFLVWMWIYEPRDPVRRRVQRRARAQPGARSGRRRSAARDQAAAARRTEAPGRRRLTRRPVSRPAGSPGALRASR